MKSSNKTMKKYLLSYIVPCFNSARTVEQSIQSIYRQRLTIPFEIIAIDDASTDSTVSVLRKMQQKHKELHVLQHRENRGGGAARNTGISHAKGNLILCVDSDNYLADNTVMGMIQEHREKHADGVAFHERVFFYKHPLIHAVHRNPILKHGFTLHDHFNGSGMLLDNFLFTKAAYEKTGGYPEHHGFDTQSFEIRFLASGFTVYVAPQSRVYHRQGDVGRSYFERVYESGEFSINMFLIYEEILHRFNRKIQQELLKFPIFTQTDIKQHNLQSRMAALYASNSSTFFQSQVGGNSLVHERERYAKTHTSSTRSEDMMWMLSYYLQKRAFHNALAQCERLRTTGIDSQVLRYYMLRCYAGLNSVDSAVKTEERTLKLIHETQITKQVSMFRSNIAFIGIRKVLRSVGIHV